MPAGQGLLSPPPRLTLGSVLEWTRVLGSALPHSCWLCPTVPYPQAQTLLRSLKLALGWDSRWRQAGPEWAGLTQLRLCGHHSQPRGWFWEATGPTLFMQGPHRTLRRSYGLTPRTDWEVTGSTKKTAVILAKFWRQLGCLDPSYQHVSQPGRCPSGVRHPHPTRSPGDRWV